MEELFVLREKGSGTREIAVSSPDFYSLKSVDFPVGSKPSFSFFTERNPDKSESL
jgi:hypothetical protein